MSGRSRGGGERGKADMHIHTLYSDGTADVQSLLDHVERETDLDLVAITDHERIDGALRAREIHAAGDYSFGLVVGEEITTRRGHLLALFLSERVPALRPLRETLERVHDQGGIAIAAHPLAPLTPSLGRRSLESSSPRRRTRGTTSTRSRSSTPPRPDGRGGRRDTGSTRPASISPRSGTRTRTCSRGSARPGPGSPARPRTTTARRSSPAR